jgi:hypothetical protein
MDFSQLLVYGLLIAGFLLFNYVLQRAAQRARQRQEQERAQQPEAAPSPEIEPIESGWGRTPTMDRRSAAASVEATRRVEANAAPPAPPPRRPVPKPLFRSTHDLRRAIIVMTVLGPCRALEPHDRR